LSSPDDPQFSELNDAARRAGQLFTQHVDEITKDAQRHADEIEKKAEQDAEDARREALESGRRVFERINALERPLGELVRTLRHEMDRVTAELGEGRYVELPGEAVTEERAEPKARPTPEPEPAPPPEPESADAGWEEAPDTSADGSAEMKSTADTDESDAVQLGPQETAVSAVPESESAVTKPRRGLLRRRKSRPFIGSPGECAVCQRSYQAADENELEASGWSISDDVGLCPNCQADGWQLPEGARLPFRRGAS
jgi:hypothetical protein